MSKSAVVILAAGIGSRMEEITKRTSKCIVDLNGITPLEHTIKSFADNGVNHIIIVVGHYKDQVIQSVKDSMIRRGLDVELEFIVNKFYNYHGCEYSLACASREFSKYDTIYVTEGDLLLNKEYVSRIVASDARSSILLRGFEFIDKTRSVVAIDNSNNPTKLENPVSQFVYDPDHNDVFDYISSTSYIRGESIQLWKFSKDALKKLTRELVDYYKEVTASDESVNHSGLYSINKIIGNDPMSGIKVDGYEWLNLNTIQDVEHAKTLPWLNR